MDYMHVDLWQINKQTKKTQMFISFSFFFFEDCLQFLYSFKNKLAYRPEWNSNVFSDNESWNAHTYVRTFMVL